MYHVSRIDDTLASTPPDYLGHSTGFRRQDLVGREYGSHHMTMSVAVLDPGGRVDATVHSYEKSLWLLDGELTLTMLGQSIALRRDDRAVVPVAVAHQLTTGAAGARWLEMSAPVRRSPPGTSPPPSPPRCCARTSTSGWPPPASTRCRWPSPG